MGHVTLTKSLSGVICHPQAGLSVINAPTKVEDDALVVVKNNLAIPELLNHAFAFPAEAAER